MPNKLSHRGAVILMIVTATLWSIAGVFTRHLDSAKGFEVTFWRSLFAGLFVLVAMVKQYGRGFVPRLRLLGRLGFLSGCMWATMYSCFMIAMTMTTVANTSIMESLAPLFTAFLAWLILRERIPARTWWAIAAACIGMGWMFAGSLSEVDSRGLLGMLIALGVPVAASVNVILLKKGGHTVDLIPAVFLGGSISALVMLPFALPLQASLHDVVLLAILGFFQLGLPCMLMVRASASLTAPEISLLCLLEVLLAPIWAWLGAGEVPAQATITGGVIVLIALVLNELASMRESSS
ncbi:DMT family transporter [Undibacterium sp. CY21W]|uniref:DMT family transporter n=1 Tax=Undibacterium sp. CY21W TaxID=2762293 RepID=UPI00164AFC3D|nr:DMT family transporter [Undibacterium sp. CY21W]MBC3929503.1 DMT family transporter [Undibacterium sp. CY21W]